jgi:THUMP domain-like/RNA cap guanine-N2 methyltransferase
VSQAALLLTPAGAELLGRVRGIDVTPDQALRLGTELRDRYPPDLVAAALTQQALRMAAREKFSLAGEMFFTRDGLEQASGEQAAAHTARRFAGLTLAADLCCGIGGDLTALVTATRQVLAVDADFDNLQFATRNAAVYGAFGAVSAVCADVRGLRLAGVPAAFIDPARRAGGHRLRAGESHPPLSWCFALADQVPQVCVKAAPGLAHALVPEGWEMEFVAVGRNLKEALLWSPGFATTTRRATVLPAGPLADAADAGHPPPEPEDAGRRTPDRRDTAYRIPDREDAGHRQERDRSHTLEAGTGTLPPVPVAAPGEYLLDPNPAVTRAGLVAELARELGAWQLDPMIAFLSLDRPASTPFARTLRVIASLPWREREVAAKLRELGVGAADIRRRGLAGDVQQIHRRLGLRGDKSATIVLTRRNDRPWGLICEPVRQDPAPG